ncbi:hypothetical protein WT53_02280 [Burkholderia sp. MSMB2157WGS]|nr:hypothetical protein WT53_02280 [Burkholderia sp. MSMB2157WGS]
MLVNYDKLMEDSRAELERMSTHLGLPRDEAPVLAFERDFLGGGPQHTRFESGDLSNANAIERHVSAMFGVLESAVQINDQAFERRAQPVIAQAQADLDDIALFLRLECQLEQGIAVLTTEAAAHPGEIETRQQCIDTQQQHIDVLASEVRDWQARAELAAAAEAELRAELVIANDAQCVSAESVESRDRIIAVYEAESAERRMALERAESTVREILRSKSWRITKPLRFLVRLASARK